jgi:hypothetical protein
MLSVIREGLPSRLNAGMARMRATMSGSGIPRCFGMTPQSRISPGYSRARIRRLDEEDRSTSLSHFLELMACGRSSHFVDDSVQVSG